MGSTGATRAVSSERPLRTELTRRQLKTHVTSALKADGLKKAETHSTAIRGFSSVSQAGYAWGEDYGGMFAPRIVFIGGWRSTRRDEYLDRVEKILSRSFKIRRNPDSVEILGEYEERK